MSYFQSLHHIVLRTKRSEQTLPLEDKQFYAFIWSILKNKQCHLYRINGMRDHLHLFVGIHSTVALAELVKVLKTSTNKWLKQHGYDFTSWGIKYAALSYSWKDKDRIINYIKNQREHHKKIDSQEEYRAFIEEMGLTLDDRDIE